MAETLPRDHVPSEHCVTERDRQLNGVFTTALEGGIGYWSRCSRYLWSLDGGETEARDFVAVITDDEGKEHVIDRTVIARGIRKAYERKGWNDYHARALVNLQFGRWDDLDYDSDTADLIVQFGLFGEQVYA